MKDRDIEAKLKQAVSKATPDVLESILSDCEEQKGNVILMTETKKKNAWARRLSVIAAAFVVIIGGVIGFRIYGSNYSVASTVSLDVNPSIEIKVNEKERVLDVTAQNEDGRTVIGDMDFAGSDLDVAVNALIGSMLRNGYLSELANSILISVDNNDPAKGAALQQKLTDEVNALLQTNTFSGAVLSQTISADKELQQLADTYDITLGKAQLIKQITEQNPLYSFEKLVPLSINELNLLSESGSNHLENINSVGTASDKAYIGIEKAKEIALAHAGLAASDITNLKTEMDYEDTFMVYEVEFRSGGFEYEYDINAVSGDIIKHKKETDDDYNQRPQTGTANTNPDSPAGSVPASSQPQANTSYIGENRAKEIALAQAGVSEADLREYKIELDRENGIMVYEVEFKSGHYEYQFDIDANTGAILEQDREYDD